MNRTACTCSFFGPLLLFHNMCVYVCMCVCVCVYVCVPPDKVQPLLKVVSGC